MSKLEQLIAAWRDTLKTTREVGSQSVVELENHLRETLAPLLRSGMNETEAFERAVAQLGFTPALTTEFKKLHQATWLPVKITTGLGIAVAVLLLVLLLINYSHNPRWNLLLFIHVFTLTLGYLAALLAGLLGICFACQHSYSTFPEWRRQQLGRATFVFGVAAACLTATGLLLGMVWSKSHMGCWWQWEPKETSALCVVAWLTCFVAVHQWRGFTAGAALITSILGNVIVSLAWFAPFLVDSHQSHGAPSYGPILLAAVIVHLGFLFSGMAPAGWLRTRLA